MPNNCFRTSIVVCSCDTFIIIDLLLSTSLPDAFYRNEDIKIVAISRHGTHGITGGTGLVKRTHGMFVVIDIEKDIYGTH
jgi:hypothetical protein